MKKLLIIMLAVGMVCMAAAAFAQTPEIEVEHFGAAANDSSLAVKVDADAAAQDNSTAGSVEKGSVGAQDSSLAVKVDADAAAQDNSTAGSVEKGSAGAQNSSTANNGEVEKGSAGAQDSSTATATTQNAGAAANDNSLALKVDADAAAAYDGEAINQEGGKATLIPIDEVIVNPQLRSSTDALAQDGLGFPSGGDDAILDTANTAGTGGSTVLGGIQNDQTLMTNPQSAEGKQAATGNGINVDADAAAYNGTATDQKGQFNNNDVNSPVQNRDSDNYGGSLAMDTGTAQTQKGQTNSIGGNALSQNGQFNNQDINSPVQNRDTDAFGPVAMDSGVNAAQFGENNAVNGNAADQKGKVVSNAGDATDNSINQKGKVNAANADAQNVEKGSIGVQDVSSPVQVRTVEMKDGALAMDTGKAQDGFVNGMDSAKMQLGLTNAMDTGVAQTGLTNNNGAGNAQTGLTNANSGVAQTGLANTQSGDANGQIVWNGGVGIQTTNSPVQYRDTDAKDNSAVAMDTGVAQGGCGNANANGEQALSVSNPFFSPVSLGGDAIGKIDKSAVATGDQGVALNDNKDFAISVGDNSPAINDNKGNIAFMAGTGPNVNVQDVKDAAASIGDNSMANQEVKNAAISNNGSTSNYVANTQFGLKNEANTVTATNGLANSGKIGVGIVNGDNTNMQVNMAEPLDGGTPPAFAVQNVSMNNLKQVNAGVAVGNGSSNFSNASITVQNNTSTVQGLFSSSNSMGLAANSASQNIVNVTANVTGPGN